MLRVLAYGAVDCVCHVVLRAYSIVQDVLPAALPTPTMIRAGCGAGAICGALVMTGGGGVAARTTLRMMW